MDSNIEQITPFDNAISSRQFQIIKSALPYIPVSEQKVISFFVKFQELKNTIHLFDGSSEETMGICSVNGNTNDNLAEMVNCIKPFCNDSEKEQLDFLYNIACAFNLSHSSKSDSENSNNNNDNNQFNIANTLRAMLSPEQQTLLDSCSLMFGLNK
ncbi:MAG: hypothetical protein K2M78_12710 [Lachnospiraceae bacterium]|nr:hypothetical protein [Lachnospiraceae bacterium]